MNAQQQRFVDEFVIDGVGAAAARRAGYKDKSAHVTASRLLKDPAIKKAIQDRYAELAMSAEEATKHVTDIARSSLNDYLRVEKVLRTPTVRKSLSQLINEMDYQDEVDDLYLSNILGLVSEELYERAQQEVEEAKANRVLKRARYAAELELNPNAFRDEKGEGVWVDDVTVDLAALAKDKQGGRIKSLSYGEYGPKVELYSADGALETILKIHGKLVNKHEVDHGFVPVDTSKLTEAQREAILAVSRQTER